MHIYNIANQGERKMDFFEYASLASIFVSIESRWISYVIGGLCFAIVFVFEAVALYTIASREGYKNKWFAFIPFLNTYYIGVCAQKNRCYKSIDTKKVALVAAIIEFLLFVGYMVYEIGYNLALPYADLVETREIYGSTYEVWEVRSIPESLAWAGWCYNYFEEYVLRWVELVYLFVEVLVLAAFFQTYASRRYMLFTITSVLFPVQGILFFIMRNNRGMNYRDFLRAEQERQYRMYRQHQQQNYSQNPYERNYGQNPYNQNPYSRGSGGEPYEGPQPSAPENGGYTNAATDDPFSEYGGSNGGGGDPFDDLTSKN